VKFGEPDGGHPAPCASVAWADAQRFEDVRLGLVVASDKMLAQTDQCVGAGEISVNGERALAFGDALVRAVAEHSHHPQ